MMQQTYVPAQDRYDQTMEYRRSGRSGLLLPELSLGFWHNFGDAAPLERQKAIARRAFDLGITYFDLANNYGPPYGSAEENFGTIFAKDFRPYRDEMIIASKAGFDMWPGPYGEWPSRKNMLASLDQSLARMGLDYVDIFYAHRPDPRIPIEETVGALATAYHQGKALYVGISNYSPQQTREAAAALADLKIPLLINQVKYSMFERHVEGGLLEVLEQVGAGCAVFSPLAQGMLTDRYLTGTVPEGSRITHSKHLSEERLNAEYLERARGLNQIAKDRGQSLAQMALTWVLRHEGITTAIIGASSVGQLEANVAALEAGPLTDDELRRIDEFAIDGTTR